MQDLARVLRMFSTDNTFPLFCRVIDYFDNCYSPRQQDFHPNSSDSFSFFSTLGLQSSCQRKITRTTLVEKPTMHTLNLLKTREQFRNPPGFHPQVETVVSFLIDSLCIVCFSIIVSTR